MKFKLYFAFAILLLVQYKMRAQNVESGQADILPYDCETVFWTVDNLGIIKQWDLSNGAVSGGDIVLDTQGYTGLAFGEVNNTGIFYCTKNGFYKKYDFSNGWTTPVTTTVNFANNGSFQDQHYLMGFSEIGILYYDNGSTINNVATIPSTSFVADVAVDSHGKAYLITKSSSDVFTISIYSQPGGLNQTIPLTVPAGYSLVCAYGMFFINDILYIAKNSCAPSDPNTLTPILINEDNAQLGTPIPFFCTACYDTASCNKHLMGVDSFEKNPLTLYPNPSQGILNIDFDGTIDEFSVYSIEGRIVNTSVQASKIDVSALKSGVYFVQIKSDGKTLTAPFVRN